MPEKKMSSKRIILSVTNDLTADQRVHKVCTSLTKHGFELMLVGRILPNSLPLVKRGYITKRLPLIFKTGFLFYAEFNYRLFFFLMKQKANLLVANDLDTLPAVSMAAFFKKIPFVYDSHEYFTEVPELTNRKLVKQIWTFLEWIFIRKAAKSYTVCNSIASIYHEKYGVDMLVVRNLPFALPVSQPKVPILTGMGKKIIIYQGSVNVGRGLEQVIEAMKFVDNAIFLIIGDGDIFKQLKRETNDNKELTDKVLFYGKIPFEDLALYTTQAQLGISLEQNLSLSYYYSLPNKIFDYIAAGVPVLASHFPEIKNIVQEYGIGLLTEKYEPKYLAEIINFMLNDEDSRAFWKANLKIAAKELNWDNEEKRLFEVYDSFI